MQLRLRNFPQYASRRPDVTLGSAIESRIRGRSPTALLVVLLGCALTQQIAAQDRGKLEATTIVGIRETAITVDVHPLPLLSRWNVGPHDRDFGAQFQIDRIHDGAHLLPWIELGQPNQTGDLHRFDALIDYAARNKLPLSFVSSEWERALVDDLRYSSRHTVTTESAQTKLLTPYGPSDDWAAVGNRWGRHSLLQYIAARYPDPPLVVMVSNNEQPKLSWEQIATSTQGTKASKQQLLAAWIARYRALQSGFRESLPATWRKHTRFVGYNAFADSALGRWPDWNRNTWNVPGNMNPWADAWDGASVSYYLNSWDARSDDIVWSPQIEAMNWVPLLANKIASNKIDTQFWFELSTWDGHEEDRAKDKRAFFQQRGTPFSPARYGGLVQFGMWLLRPRAIREFQSPKSSRAEDVPYFDALQTVVGRVHNNDTLKDFWQHGTLVANPQSAHPYTHTLNVDVSSLQRWFLLEVNRNSARPWVLQTPIDVYAIALVRGNRPNREWLVYTFEPHANRRTTGAPATSGNELTTAVVTIPSGPQVSVATGDAGCFSLVFESNNKATTIVC